MDLKQIDFKTFSNFWVILLIFAIIICIIFFITGIKDKDVIVYSILVFVAAIVLFHSWKDNKHSKKISLMSILLNFAKSTFPPIYTIINYAFLSLSFYGLVFLVTLNSFKGRFKYYRKEFSLLLLFYIPALTYEITIPIKSHMDSCENSYENSYGFLCKCLWVPMRIPMCSATRLASYPRVEKKPSS